MATKINPPDLSSGNYELYKEKLLAWQMVTDIPVDKQGIVIALTLPNDDKHKIQEEVFSQIGREKLSQENGLDTLINFLDSKLMKDDLSDSLEKFEEFEDFQRVNGQNITEYIAAFDSRYRKMEKFKIKLPSEILAFKLLRRANISKEEKMLVLTGMNYANRETLYEEAKQSLKKFKGDITEGSISTAASVKLEPAFLAENEEALLAAGYYKQGQGKRSVRTGRGGYSRGGGQRGQGQEARRKMNPTGPDGKPLTCRVCGSYRHLMKDCPDSWENIKKVNIVEDENVVLFTGYNKEEIYQLGVDARNCAILDSACSSTVCGQNWMDSYINSLNEVDRKKIKQTTGERTFKFGGGTRLKSRAEYCLPAVIAGKEVTIKTDVVGSDIPLLLSRTAMKRAGVKMDPENDSATIFGKDIALNLTTSGHYCIPIDRTENIAVEEVFSVKLEEMGRQDKVIAAPVPAEDQNYEAPDRNSENQLSVTDQELQTVSSETATGSVENDRDTDRNTERSTRVKVNDNIRYKLGDEWVNGTIMSRAGKASGKYKNWYNVRNENNDERSIDLERHESRPDMAFEMINMSTKLKQGTVENLVRVIKKISRMKDFHSYMTFPRLNKAAELKIVVFTDASLGNINEGTGSTGAYIVWLMDNTGQCCPIAWNAHKIKRVVRSTLAAETLGLEEGLEASYYYREMLASILGVKTRTVMIEAYVDNKSIIEAILSTRLVEDKRLRVDVAAIKESLQLHDVKKIQWVPGHLQLANPMTKQGASGFNLLKVLQSGKMLDELC